MWTRWRQVTPLTNPCNVVQVYVAVSPSWREKVRYRPHSDYVLLTFGNRLDFIGYVQRSIHGQRDPLAPVLSRKNNTSVLVLRIYDFSDMVHETALIFRSVTERRNIIYR